MLHYLISLLLCIKLSTSAQILTGYYQILNNHLNFALPVGPKEGNLILSFDQEAQYSYTEEYRAEEERDKNIIGKTTVEAFGKSIEGIEVKEQIHFNMFGEGVDTNILFKVIPKESKENHAKGAYSFAYKYDNEDYSLIHYLKKNDLIPQLSYTIGYADSFKAGFVYFGGIHERATMRRKSLTCPLDPNYSSWGCQLSQIVINHKMNDPSVYQNKARSYFQAAKDYIYVPKDFYILLNETVFKSYYDKGNCYTEIESEDIGPELFCSKTAIEKMPELIIGFGEQGVIVKMMYLFESNAFKNSQKSLIRYKDDEDVWIFGSPIMQPFSIMFDYENKTISIYSLDEIEEMKDFTNDIDKRFSLIVFMVIIGVIGVIIIIVHKNQRYNTNDKESYIKEKRMSINDNGEELRSCSLSTQLSDTS